MTTVPEFRKYARQNNSEARSHLGIVYGMGDTDREDDYLKT
jgi:hypothetical protein